MPQTGIGTASKWPSGNAKPVNYAPGPAPLNKVTGLGVLN